MSKQVRFRITPDNQVTMTTEGYIGMSCKDSSKRFETLGTVLSDDPTEEMYLAEDTLSLATTDSEPPLSSY